MSSSLMDRLVAILPGVPNVCPDPQCGDPTWDHPCELGGSKPNYALAKVVAAEVQDWLFDQATTWSRRGDEVLGASPVTAAEFHKGARTISTLAAILILDDGVPSE